MKKYCISYEMGDKTFGDTIEAEDWDDAEKRLECIKRSARIDGQLVDIIPAWIVSTGLMRPYLFIKKCLLPFGSWERDR